MLQQIMWAGLQYIIYHRTSFFDQIKDTWRFCLWQWKYTGKKRVDLLTSLRDNWDLDLWVLLAKIRLPTWLFIDKHTNGTYVKTPMLPKNLQKASRPQFTKIICITNDWSLVLNMSVLWLTPASLWIKRSGCKFLHGHGHLVSQRHRLIRWVSDLSAAGHTLHSSKD